MKTSHIVLSFLIAVFFVSCKSDDQEYEYFNVAKPVTIPISEFRASVEVLPPQNIVESGKIYAYQQYIFVNDLNKGVHVIDNRNPLQPTKINYIKIPLNKDVSVKNGFLYADSGRDLVVFDISNIMNIHVVGRAEDVIQNYIEYPEDVAYYDTSEYNHETQIILDWDIVVEKREISDMYYVELATNDTGTGGSLARFKIVDDYLYAIDNSKINVFDIQNLNDPVKVNEEYVVWEAETIFNRDDKLFIGSRTGMFVYDISQPEAPQYISEFNHIRSCDPVVVDGDYAYVTLRSGVTCVDGVAQNLESRLEIINIQDLYNPQLQETYTMDEPYGLGTKENLLFLCDGTSGLKVYNKTDVSNLQLVNHFENINAFDVIPMEEKLLMVGNNVLTQYLYNENGIELLSVFTIE